VVVSALSVLFSCCSVGFVSLATGVSVDSVVVASAVDVLASPPSVPVAAFAASSAFASLAASR
jgi:hypothetical protein